MDKHPHSRSEVVNTIEFTGFKGTEVPKTRVVTTSNQTTDNKRILTDVYLRELSGYLAAIHNKFGQLYGPTAQTADFAMEIEFKITSDGKLSIKQARPWGR
jgi:hypothetical protein